ncbi:hypothetical protein RAMDARK_1802, partial [Rickettsia amblyommatis str. Darkwater]
MEKETQGRKRREKGFRNWRAGFAAFAHTDSQR